MGLDYIFFCVCTVLDFLDKMVVYFRFVFFFH